MNLAFLASRRAFEAYQLQHEQTAQQHRHGHRRPLLLCSVFHNECEIGCCWFFSALSSTSTPYLHVRRRRTGNLALDATKLECMVPAAPPTQQFKEKGVIAVLSGSLILTWADVYIASIVGSVGSRMGAHHRFKQFSRRHTTLTRQGPPTPTNCALTT